MPHPAHHTQNWESEQLQKARGNQLATGKHPEAWQAAGKQQVDPPKNRRHLFKLEKRPSVCLSACLFSPGRPNAAGTSLGQKRPLSAGIKGRRAETNSFPTWHFDLSSVTDRCPFGSPSPKSHFYPGGAAASPPPSAAETPAASPKALPGHRHACSPSPGASRSPPGTRQSSRPDEAGGFLTRRPGQAGPGRRGPASPAHAAPYGRGPRRARPAPHRPRAAASRRGRPRGHATPRRTAPRGPG